MLISIHLENVALFGRRGWHRTKVLGIAWESAHRLRIHSYAALRWLTSTGPYFPFDIAQLLLRPRSSPEPTQSSHFAFCPWTCRVYGLPLWSQEAISLALCRFASGTFLLSSEKISSTMKRAWISTSPFMCTFSAINFTNFSPSGQH